MSINLGNVLVLLPLSLLLPSGGGGGGGIPSAAGQNTLLNITASDITDLVDNVTERVDDDGDNNISSRSSSGSMSSSSVITSQTVRINEIELNPMGDDDEGKEWIELYNPSDGDINISNFEIRTSSKSATIKLSPDAIIAADETYVIELEEQILSNIVESLILADATDNILDRTPSLVDMSNDERTWQRIPDGNKEWRFAENTRGNLNDPDSRDETHDSAYSESYVECLGSAGCAEGMAIRIVNGDTLYVSANSTVYKVDLALIETPSRTEEGLVESTAFTRDLCLGSTALIDQDDKLLISADSSVIAVMYCSSSNVNSELLDNGYAELDVQQCAISEFANEPWAKDHGC